MRLPTGRQTLTLSLILALTIGLGGCGRAGKPLQPPNAFYPRTYPDAKQIPTQAREVDGKALPPEWTKEDLDEAARKGTYVDPSVNLQQIQNPAFNQSIRSSNPQGDIMDKGLGAPSTSPLPPPDIRQPDTAQ